MYQFAYSDVVDDSPLTMRASERAAMDRVIAMLRIAQESGVGSQQAVQAFYYLRRLWAIFMNDLANPENELPEQMRHGLLSIGLWMNKEIDRVRGGQASDLTPIIEINEIIRDGLK
jgi:flagellar protein FlaF